MTRAVANGLALIAIVTAITLGRRAQSGNDELALASPPLAREPPRVADPHAATRRARRARDRRRLGAGEANVLVGRALTSTLASTNSSELPRCA